MRPYPQPFVTSMREAGVTASMPLFVKSLFTLMKQADSLRLSAQKRKKLKFIEKEALLVATDAEWIYVENMLGALAYKERSLRSSLKTVDIKVKNGRAPESARFKLLEALEQINISQNSLKIRIEALKATIFELTGKSVDRAIPLRQQGKVTKGALFALEPLREKAKADALALKAEKEQRYPSLVASGKYFYKAGEAYNNGKDVDERYGSYGIYLMMPLFDKTQSAKIEKTKLQQRKSRMRIVQSGQEGIVVEKSDIVGQKIALGKPDILLKLLSGAPVKSEE